MSRSPVLCLAFIMIMIPLGRFQIITISLYHCTILYNNGGNASAILTQCQYPGGSTNSWNNCRLHCCPSASIIDYPNFTQSVLAICQAQVSQKQSLSLAIIIMAIVVSLFSLIIVVCLCMVLTKLLKSIYKNRVSHEPEQDQEIQWENPQRLTINIQFPRWFKQKMRLSHLDSNCIICLQDDSCAELICGHIYHPNCIVTWLNKSNFCPLCHRDDIRAVKVYCKQCLSQCLLIRKKLLRSNIDQIQKCDSCLKASIIQKVQNGKNIQLKNLCDNSHINIFSTDQSKNLIFEDYHSEIIEIQ